MEVAFEDEANLSRLRENEKEVEPNVELFPFFIYCMAELPNVNLC